MTRKTKLSRLLAEVEAIKAESERRRAASAARHAQTLAGYAAAKALGLKPGWGLRPADKQAVADYLTA
jgi:hypothetical protein